MVDSKGEGLKVGFDGSMRLEFHRAKVTSDAGLLAYRDLDEALVIRGESRVKSRARDLRSLARREEESMLGHRRRRVTRSSGRKPLAPFGLRRRGSVCGGAPPRR